MNGNAMPNVDYNTWLQSKINKLGLSSELKGDLLKKLEEVDKERTNQFEEYKNALKTAETNNNSEKEKEEMKTKYENAKIEINKKLLEEFFEKTNYDPANKTERNVDPTRIN
jgi:Fe2+ transport system protein B